MICFPRPVNKILTLDSDLDHVHMMQDNVHIMFTQDNVQTMPAQFENGKNRCDARI